MKITFTLFMLFFAMVVANAQSINVEYQPENGQPYLLGKINREGLSSGNYADWFQKNYTSYSINEKVIHAIGNQLDQFTIVAFMGTWCGDSKREVPRFYKILDDLNFPLERLTLVAVDRAPNAYKQSPGGEHEGMQIHRVPTFIFFRDGKEVNRITERPVGSLEADILSILKGTYAPNYKGVSLVQQLLMNTELEKFGKKARKLMPELKAQIESRYELNTYGKVLTSEGRDREAIAVFELNTWLFPEETGTFLSLANTLGTQGNITEAIINYEKVLKIDPENDEALSGIRYLKSQISN